MMPDPNLHILEEVAARLFPLLDSVVFVGGVTLGVLLTDTGGAPIRATIDVDVIAEIASYLDYIAFSEQLRACGFTEDARPGAPLCRWLHGDLILDVMPIEESVLGFSNRWYRGALYNSQQLILPSKTSIRVITAPYFLGTKIEAFRSRGKQDFYESHDLEDFVSVIDGRPSLLDEIAATTQDLRIFLAEAAKELLMQPIFLDALPGYLMPDIASQQRLPGLIRKLEIISRT
ncbi:hypothetical protein [Acidicapsa ligni]|uniref:hypothetical protein n=1 Tax=Acidicapsa ligni TaxID=542300 RepID=UPI0021DF4A40|nr:hypothetical protein [Acidicapsa ligni]